MKLYVSSDFLMTKEKEQFSNLKWFFDILARPIKVATGENIEMFKSSLSSNGQFSRREFFSLSNVELDIHATQYFFSDDDIHEDSLSYLTSFLNKGDLLIGYELSEQTRRILERIGVIYIDVWLHPVRFLDDILFCFSSNKTEVSDSLNGFLVKESVFWLYADRLKVSAYKGYKRKNINLAENSALFVGQTLEDKAVCKDGKMLNLLDFKNEYEAALKKYSHVYYSRHPYVKNGDEEIIKYVKSFSNSSVVDIPAYDMLANKNLRYVFSISSSVAIEAKYFGKQVDLLHKPIVDFIGDDPSYKTVFQSFLSPHFWASTLETMLPIKSSEKIEFLDKKDKLRDMLAFYWSYKQVDKIEMMRSQLNAVDYRVQDLSRKKVITTDKKDNENLTLIIPKYHNGKSELSEIKKQIDSHEIISFDVFDTLLNRPFSKPDDLFYAMGEILKKDKFEINSTNDFRDMRLKSRSLVSPEDVKNEEVLLECRYRALAKEYGLSEKTSSDVYKLELDLEKNTISKRSIGYEIFNYAKSKNKKIVLITDTFFEEDFVCSLLVNNGYNGWDAVYASSTVGLLKATGNLYPHVLGELAVTADKVLHFGDNKKVDIVNAKEHGIHGVHLPKAIENLEATYEISRSIVYKDVVYNSLVKGVISNKISDSPFEKYENSFFPCNAYNFGYSIFGQLILPFVNWLLKSSISNGDKHLYFLARDGEIIKKAYDLVSKEIPDAPKSHYIYASRRSLSIASIFDIDDALSLLDNNYSETTLSEFFENRFGLKNVDDFDYSESEFLSGKDLCSLPRDREKISRFIKINASSLLNISDKERGLLLKYYKDNDLDININSSALVDIGHAGTLQRYISKLFKGASIPAYYYVTFEGITKNKDLNLPYYSYLMSEVSPKDKGNLYIKNILLFEIMFLNDKGSFICMEENGNSYKPVLKSLKGEENRVDFTKLMHSGALDFVSDMIFYIDAIDYKCDINPKETISSFISFVDKPRYFDVVPFVDMVFENSYSGRGVRRLIDKKKLDQSIWTQGAKVFSNYYQSNSESKAVTKFINLLYVMGFYNTKQVEKFRRDPVRFFKDSRSKFIRFVGLLGGYDK